MNVQGQIKEYITSQPEPWVLKTKFIDFKVGGRRFYAIVRPEGHECW